MDSGGNIGWFLSTFGMSVIARGMMRNSFWEDKNRRKKRLGAGVGSTLSSVTHSVTLYNSEMSLCFVRRKTVFSCY